MTYQTKYWQECEPWNSHTRWNYKLERGHIKKLAVSTKGTKLMQPEHCADGEALVSTWSGCRLSGSAWVPCLVGAKGRENSRVRLQGNCVSKHDSWGPAVQRSSGGPSGVLPRWIVWPVGCSSSSWLASSHLGNPLRHVHEWCHCGKLYSIISLSPNGHLEKIWPEEAECCWML